MQMNLGEFFFRIIKKFNKILARIQNLPAKHEADMKSEESGLDCDYEHKMEVTIPSLQIRIIERTRIQIQMLFFIIEKIKKNMEKIKIKT